MFTFLFYISYTYIRMIYPIQYIKVNYKDLENTLKTLDWLGLVSIYLLWTYWYYLINKKVYKILKSSLTKD